MSVFNRLQAIIISLGNKCDLKDDKQVEFNAANKWAQMEKSTKNFTLLHLLEKTLLETSC